MEPFVRRFIRSSLIWFLVGGALGIDQLVRPFGAAAMRPAHVHATLLGFVSMMIFGVAYHVLPRFSGAPLHSRRLAALHLWLANLGVAGMVLGWGLRTVSAAPGQVLLGVGGAASALGGLLFVYNLWRTLDAGMAPTRMGAAAIRSRAPQRVAP